MRNPIACVSCRSAKQKCIHDDNPPCERCQATGRADDCEFPPPGTSAVHRRPKRPRVEDSTYGSTPPSTSTTLPSRPDALPRSPTANAASLLEGLDPFDLLTDDVKNSYLRCSYKWSFHHTPTLLLRIRDRTLEQWMAWAILALAIRFVKDTPRPFKTQTEASNAFAAHARQLLQSELETPSVSRVQALLMLTGHDWGAGNGQRAWIYLGMAIRLVEIMDLCREPKMPKNRMPTREEFIEAEGRRRTAWTCFLMDSLLSGGKGRKRSLTAEDMAIQLPCEQQDFVFGRGVCLERLDGKVMMPQIYPKGELGIVAYSMRVANIWGRVARWACSDVVTAEFPWSQTSEFQHLLYDLGEWKRSLPDRLQYDLFSLHSHNAVEQGQAYCYMHCIYSMSYMFLHRAYVPVLGPQSGALETHRAYTESPEQFKNWQKTARRELFRESTLVLEMLDEMRSFGVYFLRGLVPWIGFTIYTAVGVMLYSVNFPSGEDDINITEKARERVRRGCTFLTDMQPQWPMARTWFETIKRMRVFYRTVVGHDGPVSPDEQQALRRAMIDYGALQPSPVQKPGDSRPGDTPHHRSSIVAESANAPPVSLMSPPVSTPSANVAVSTPIAHGTAATPNSHGRVTTPNAYVSNMWNSHTASPSLEDEPVFDFDFDMSNADMEQMMMTATQDFWASFPGEVGSML